MAQQEEPSKQKSVAEVDDETADSYDEKAQGDNEQGFVRDLPPNVIEVRLSNETAVLNCQDADKDCPGKILDVAVVAEDIGENTYVYTVSGGNVVGEGPNVKWDLSNTEPGVYTITAGIGLPTRDGKEIEVLGRTFTKTVIVMVCRECP